MLSIEFALACLNAVLHPANSYNLCPVGHIHENFSAYSTCGDIKQPRTVEPARPAQKALGTFLCRVLPLYLFSTERKR